MTNGYGGAGLILLFIEKVVLYLAVLSVAYQLGKLKPKLGEIVPKEFAFAYAITVHKAQGSEWPNLLLLEERFPFDPLEHARHLYTGATRAEDKLVLVR